MTNPSETSPGEFSTAESGSDLLSELHDRYLLLSGRFKSAWTFHQFLKGVNKVFAEQSLELGTISFQSIYSELKVASKNLNVASAETANRHLDGAEKELESRLELLLDVDDRLTPTLLRRFFKRVRNYDARILGQLLKFYLFTRGSRWSEDRLDKADFLMTRLGELLLELDLDPVERQPQALRDALRGIWQVVGEEQPSNQVVEAAEGRLEALQASMKTIETLEDFHEMGSIQSYRQLKKELGSVFFHPRVAHHIVDINLLLASRVEELYQREERRVAVEYNKVFDLERGVPQLEDTLDSDLRMFRSQVEDLEKSVEGQNVKIDLFVGVKETARELIPRLEGLGKGGIHSDDDFHDGAGPVGLEWPDEEVVEQAEQIHAAEPAGFLADASTERVGNEPQAESAEQSAEELAEGSLTDAAEASPDLLEQAPALPDFFVAPLGPPRSLAAELDGEPRASTAAGEEVGDTLADLDSHQPSELEDDLQGWRPRALAAQAQLAAVADARAAAGVMGGEDDWREGLSAERPEETLRIRTAHADELGDVLRQVLQVLEQTDWQQAPKLAVHVPEVRGMRLEPREILAYRRLFFPDRFDRPIEQFLVEAASLRVLMAHQAEEIADFVDSADEPRTGALHEQALHTTALASEFEKRCNHFVQQAVLERRVADASAFQVIWMRLLREYSGLWLLLHR